MTLVRPAGPIALAAGACAALAPTGAANGTTVYLDPGHGGRDTGAATTVRGRTVYESDLTLAIAERTATALRARGFRVVLARRSDTTVARLRPHDVDGRYLSASGVHRDISARNLCANAARARVLVSIHLNSFASSSVAGTETIYNANRRFSARSLRLATLVQHALRASLAAAGDVGVDRGVITDASVGGTALTRQAAAYGQLLELGPASPPWFRYPTTMPGIVAEPLFLTNGAQARLATSAAGRAAIARGIARGVAAYVVGG